MRIKGAFLFSSTITGIIEEIYPLFLFSRPGKALALAVSICVLCCTYVARAGAKRRSDRSDLQKQRLPTAAADRPTKGEKEAKVDGIIIRTITSLA